MEVAKIKLLSLKFVLIVISICLLITFTAIGFAIYGLTWNPPAAVQRFYHFYNVEEQLEREIKNDVVPKVQSMMDDTADILTNLAVRFMDVEPVRERRSVSDDDFMMPRELDPLSASEMSDDKSRRKRLASAERELSQLKSEAERCEMYHGKGQCTPLFRRMEELSREIYERINEMRGVVRQFQPFEERSSGGRSMDSKIVRISVITTERPRTEKPKETVSLFRHQMFNEAPKDPPRIHEDLHDSQGTFRFNKERLDAGYHRENFHKTFRNPMNDQRHLIDFDLGDPVIINAEVKTTTTTTTPSPKPIVGHLKQLCDAYNHIKPLDLSPRPASAVGNMQTTGEGSKNFAQTIVSPMTAPVCMMGPAYPPMVPNFYPQPYFQQPYMRPQSMGPMFPPNFGSGRGFGYGPTGNMYCAVQGGMTGQSLPQLRTSEDPSEPNIPSVTDIIYASFENETQPQFRKPPVNCPAHQLSCLGSGECVDKSKWCDSKVDCMDVSDEAACNCKVRLHPSRICDSIVDCPQGEDEKGCFGCDRNSFSCYHSHEDYTSAGQAMASTCYTITNRCDGFRNCMNGKDEEDCTILVDKLRGFLSHSVSYTEGTLYHNFKGTWYPVCKNPEAWAHEACENEVGHLSSAPQITQAESLSGSHINGYNRHFVDSLPTVQDHCEFSNYVRCPPLKCGRVKVTHIVQKRGSPFKKTPKSMEDGRQTTTTKPVSENVGIVGGHDCAPHQWPFVVAIFRNGRQYCGGAIISPEWIVTAAHCFIGMQKYYYEIRAGMLRQTSYSPELQIKSVERVIVHEGFSVSAMIHDIALVKLQEPLKYNRFVRPICLPGPGKSGTPADWKHGPPSGLTCTVMGWGLLNEDGDQPDQLKEVQLPILPACKKAKGQVFCAGVLEGGKDSCQGDSGGPFICRGMEDAEEYYLAGVVSYGHGCARPGEAGVYTKMTAYLDWVDRMQKVGEGVVPQQECPGFKCIWGGGKCLRAKLRCNGKIDCLGGEDEIHCNFNHNSLRALQGADDEDEPARNTLRDIANFTFVTPLADADRFTSMEITTTNVPPLPAPTDTTTALRTTTEETTVGPPPEITTALWTTTTTEDTKVGPPPEITTALRTEDTTFGPSTESTTNQKTTTEETTVGPPTEIMTSEETTIEETTEEETTSPETTTEPVTSFIVTPRMTTTRLTTTEEIALIERTTESPTTTTTTEENIDPELPPIDGRILIPTTTLPPQTISGRARFICTEVRQSIHIAHRCDRQIDCDDGTDERNCTCKDYLLHNDAEKICNGVVDCMDYSDEDGCVKCPQETYTCRYSQTCIQFEQRCDGVPQCPHAEDETNCITLSDGHQVLLTPDLEPALVNKGYVTVNVRGVWRIYCDRAAADSATNQKIALESCKEFGFAGLVSFGADKIERRLLNNTVSDKADKRVHAHPSENVELVHENQNLVDGDAVAAPQDCVAILVECIPRSHGGNAEPETSTSPPPLEELPRPTEKPEVVIPDKRSNGNQTVGYKSHQWPFMAVMFVEGKIHCVGVLVSRDWALFESSCLNLVFLHIDYVVVLLGGSNTYLQIQTPYEVISRVDCKMDVSQTSTTLLHLEQPAVFNRHVWPSFFSKESSPNDTCVAVTHDKFGRQRSWPLETNSTECPKDFKCFKMNNDSNVCDLQDSKQPGVVVCSTDRKAWFPVGFYASLSSVCGEINRLLVFALNSEQHYPLNVLDETYCPSHGPPALCYGHRCPLGGCLPEHRVCDGTVDCHDASDESDRVCEGRWKKECTKAELRCGNGKCVAKSKFCDHTNDCGDYTDEPLTCSCYTYLNATDPTKICDGVRNCFDKQDENIEICRCRHDTFRCGNSLKCVPMEFVCDTEKDCPNGEDEEHCYGVRDTNTDYDGYHEVMHQFHGLWHTNCFPKDRPITQENITALCELIGYKEIEEPKARARVDSETVAATHSGNNSAVEFIVGSPIQSEPTMAVIYNKFSPVPINQQFTLYMKPSKSLVKLVTWDKKEHEDCFRLEIKCK